MRKILIILILLLPVSVSIPQFLEYHPELDWFTIKGKHVFVHYHSDAERTARIVAKIGDEVWDPITSLYDYTPDPVHYVIKDIDDYANGASFFFDNKIEIWASSLDFDLRGSHNWLRNVISHEFTHMVQLQAAMKLGRSVPGVYLQFLNYEDKRRPDILYGFPNFIISYPIASINVPAWFAEGTAQYMRSEFNYDNWDSHRDMILRSYALDDRLLTWNEMGVFGKTSLGNESVYNSGFALTKYIAQKYGEDKLKEITNKLGKLTNFTIDAAFEDALGKSGTMIYDEWKEFLIADYRRRTAGVLENTVQGDLIAGEGFGNFYPVFTKDGNGILYISNKSADYFSQSSVYLYDLIGKSEKLIADGINSTVQFIPGQNRIIYSRLSDKNENWSNIHDLYAYDLDSDEETRLTFGLRADQPAVSGDGSKIAFIFQKDGTVNLGAVNITGGEFRRLTFFENGEQIYNPKFSTDDRHILFDYSYHHGRDIARVSSDGSGFEFILNSQSDERNPVMKNSDTLIYVSDETGIFNIYSMNLKTGESVRVSNVVGGAFYPDINEKGDIVYSSYTSGGYKIYLLGKEEQREVNSSKSYVKIQNPPLDTEKPKGDIKKFDIAGIRNFNDYEVTGKDGTEYSGTFSKLTFVPFVRFDNYNLSNSGLDKVKPGLIVYSFDMLNRYSIFGGGAINKRLERDLFLIFEYKNRLPLLYQAGLKPEIALEFYSISRQTNVDVLFGVDSTFSPPRPDFIVNTDVSYDLFEFDFVAKHKIFNPRNELEFRFIFSSYTSKLGSFILPDGNGTLYPTTKDNYFIGRNFQIKYSTEAFLPYIDSDINPIGTKLELQYNMELNKFNAESNYEIRDGVLVPIYDNYNFQRVELNFRHHHRIFAGHVLSAKIRASSILGPAVPDFFDYYLGGLIGMKGYPFYALSGNELGWLNISYTFPLLREIDLSLGHLYFDKIFLTLYGDIGNAWTGAIPSLSEFKKGAGAEIRLKLNSFYLFPTSIFFNAAYAFDEYTRTVRSERISYGKEWEFYGGILFDFDISID